MRGEGEGGESPRKVIRFVVGGGKEQHMWEGFSHVFFFFFSITVTLFFPGPPTHALLNIEHLISLSLAICHRRLHFQIQSRVSHSFSEPSSQKNMSRKHRGGNYCRGAGLQLALRAARIIKGYLRILSVNEKNYLFLVGPSRPRLGLSIIFRQI